MANFGSLGPGPFTVRTFRDWLGSRSPEERWELIDGVAMMSPAPRVAHQRIASNLEYHLRNALRERRPDWRVEREIGIEIADDSPYRPEPEVTIVDRRVNSERTYLDRFYLAAEVVSESDKGRVMEAKVAFYRLHPHALWILVIQQLSVEVELHARGQDGVWRSTTLNNPSAEIRLGEIGRVCTLRDLYEDTPLDPDLSAIAP